jgi:hypothetical protein
MVFVVLKIPKCVFFPDFCFKGFPRIKKKGETGLWLFRQKKVTEVVAYRRESHSKKFSIFWLDRKKSQKNAPFFFRLSKNSKQKLCRGRGKTHPFCAQKWKNEGFWRFLHFFRNRKKSQKWWKIEKFSKSLKSLKNTFFDEKHVFRWKTRFYRNFPVYKK